MTRIAHANPDLPEIRGATDVDDAGQARRIVTLIALLAIGALWLQHHLGFELEKLGWVALGGLVWGTMGKIADWLGAGSAIGRVADQLFKAPLRRGTRALARPTPLYMLGAILVVTMATISSVTVRSDSSGERSAIALSRIDGPARARTNGLSADHPAVRFFPVATSPFGNLYRLDADGYLPKQLLVYPLVGRQVLLGRDLAPAPTVLFRPFGDGVPSLEDGAVFTVSRVRNGRAERLVSSSGDGTATSFLLGSRTSITDATMVLWAFEATAGGASEAVRAKLLVTWRNPKQLAMDGELAPRDCLLAEIRLQGELRERAVVTLTDAPFVDILMRGVGADTARVPSC